MNCNCLCLLYIEAWLVKYRFNYQTKYKNKNCSCPSRKLVVRSIVFNVKSLRTLQHFDFVNNSTFFIFSVTFLVFCFFKVSVLQCALTFCFHLFWDGFGSSLFSTHTGLIKAFKCCILMILSDVWGNVLKPNLTDFK